MNEIEIKTRKCPACLADVPAEAKICMHCRKDLYFHDRLEKSKENSPVTHAVTSGCLKVVFGIIIVLLFLALLSIVI